MVSIVFLRKGGDPFSRAVAGRVVAGAPAILGQLRRAASGLQPE